MMTNTTTPTPPPFTIKIMPSTNGMAEKLADAEITFNDGPLAGMRLIGFAVWQRRTGQGHNVTFPARTYTVAGERRSFALLRPTDSPDASERIRALIVQAYAEYAEQAEADRIANAEGLPAGWTRIDTRHD